MVEYIRRDGLCYYRLLQEIIYYVNFFLSREDLSPIRDIYDVLRRFAAFCGILRHFAAPQKALAIDSVAGPNIWGGSNPRPLFWSVENNRAKMGGNGPLSPLKTFFLASSWGDSQFV